MTVSRIAMSAEGPEVSRLVFGCWRLLEDERGSGPEVVLEKIDACLELGITTFDHADIYGGYGCEPAFGEAIRLRPALRDQIEVVTKCDIALATERRPDHRLKHYNTSASHITASVDQSLRALNVDRIDVLLLHRPDPLMDADDTAAALDGLIDAGKIGHAGVSNFLPGQVDLLQSRLSRPLVTNQLELSVLHTAALYDGTLDQCQMVRSRPMAWSPMSRGRLFEPDDEQASRVRATLQKLAGKHDAGVDRVALAWVMMHPSGPIPILGTNRIDRIRDAADAERVAEAMDRQDWFEVLEASTGHPVP